MNPYVYSKRKHGLANTQPPAPVPSSAWSLVKEVCAAPISSVVAFAFVIFAAGSVASMSLASYSDIASAGDVGIQVAHAQTKAKVLGDSTVAPTPIIDDASLEAGEPVARIEAKSVSFNSNGRWNYKISYTASNITNGQITIGTYSLVSGIVNSGSIETGAILKPGITYHLTFWNTDLSGNKVKVQSINLKTLKAKTQMQPCDSDNNFCPPIGTGIPSPCSINSDDCKKLPPFCTSDSKTPCVPPCPQGQTCPPTASTTPLNSIEKSAPSGLDTRGTTPPKPPTGNPSVSGSGQK